MMNLLGRGMSVGGLVVLAGWAPAVVIRHDVEDKKYRDLGAEKRFDPVGLFEYTASSSTGFGTANYVGKGKDGKKWFLTAAHVINGSMTKATMTLGGKTYDVDLASRIWVSGHTSGLNDIGAFAIKDTDNTLTMSPAKVWNTTLPIPADTKDRWTGYAVGFGDTGTGTTGATTEDKKKRGMTNKIDALNLNYNSGKDKLYGYISDFDKNDAANNTLDKTDFAAANFDAGQASSRTWLDLEGQLAPGDSGGGLFADVSSTFALVGIASSITRLGSGSTSTYGAYTKWSPINAENLERIERWTGVKAVPEPATLTALGLGPLTLSRRRRRA